MPNISRSAPIATAAARPFLTAVAVLAALVIALTSISLSSTFPAAAADSPLSVHVSGNRIVDGSGRPLRLLGVNKAGTEYACAQGWGIFDGPVDDAAIAAMRTWKISAVRVPLNEHCWLGRNGASPQFSGETYRAAVQGFVERLHAAGLVAVLDLHWSAPGDRLALGQQVMADSDHSVDFWASVAARFQDDPAVVFDLFNEPHDISWECWRSGCVTPEGWLAAGMQQLIDAVRATGARQPVLAAGLNWGGDLSQWLAHAPSDPVGQLGASVHIYSFSQCRDATCWDATVAPVAAGVPVVTTELGEDQCTGEFTRTYLEWADRHGVDYLAWTWNTWDCRSGPALITNTDGSPTVFGAALRDHLAASTTPTPTPSPTKTRKPPRPRARPS